MAQKSRLAVWAHIVCACFVLVCFLSVSLAATHAGHGQQCQDDDCAICCVLDTTRQLLRSLAAGGAATLTLAAAFRCVALAAMPLFAARRATPVLLADRIDS